MKRTAFMLAAFAAFAAAAASRTATEAYVTNRVTQAAIAATNYTDAAIAALPAPDYSPTNAELVETIEATAPAPGNYSIVSNRAMNATGNFLAVDGPFFWESEKAIQLNNGFLCLDNTGTGGTMLNITYLEVLYGYSKRAFWGDIIDAANAHAAGVYATPDDMPPAVSNIVTTAFVRERLGVYLYVGEDGGIYVHTNEDQEP